MKYIFPIGGKGKRFLEKADINKEFLKPKPLINILGKPMVKWAVESFSHLSPKEMIFSVMQEHIDKFKIDKKLKKIFGNEITIVIDKMLKGAIPGVLCIDNVMNEKDSFVSIDCDAVFEGDKFIQAIEKKDPDCAVPVFNATEDKFSFAKVDKNMNITQTAEKLVISNWAIHGAYYFRSWKQFKEFAEEKMRKQDTDGKNEYYIAPLINEYIKKNMKVIAVPTKLESMGTPELLDKFIKTHNT